MGERPASRSLTDPDRARNARNVQRAQRREKSPKVAAHILNPLKRAVINLTHKEDFYEKFG